MTRLKKFLLKEGGQAVESAVRLNGENYKPTMDDIKERLFPALNLSEDDYSPIGSSGKKKENETYGDIDIAVSIPAILDNEDIDTIDEVYDYLESKVSQFSDDYNKMKGLGIVSVAWPIQGPSQEGQNVQVDLMPTDSLEWSKFAYFSPEHYESKYKGAYRNMLIAAVAKYANMKTLKTAYNKEGEEVPVEWERLMYKMDKGLTKAVQNIIGKKGNIVKTKKKMSEIIYSKDPEVVAKVLFGNNVKPNDLRSYENILRLINSNDFIYKDKRDEILQHAAEGLQKAGLAVPEELEGYL